MPKKNPILLPIIEIPLFILICVVFIVLFYYAASQDYNKEPNMATINATTIRGKAYFAIFIAREPINIGQLSVDIKETESSTKVAVKSLLRFNYILQHTQFNGKSQRYFFSAKKTEFDLRRVLLDSGVGDRILFDRDTEDYLGHCLCNYNQMNDKTPDLPLSDTLDLPLSDKVTEESYVPSPFSSSTLIMDAEDFM